jgi:hypothetical protein
MQETGVTAAFDMDGGQGDTQKPQQCRSFELDMQETGVTAAFDREGGQGNTQKPQQCQGFELDMQETGVTIAFDRKSGQGKCAPLVSWFLSKVGEGVLQFAQED